MKVALVSPAFPVQGPLYGAQKHILGLFHAFQKVADIDWLQVPTSEATWDDVLRSYLDCYDLDVAKYDLVISTKNPTFMVQHPNHTSWLLHQMRVFYDRFDDEYGHYDPSTLAEQKKRQRIIHKLDNFAFSRVRKIFTNGYETASRLKAHNGFDAEVLHPPLFNERYFCGGQEYLLLPGRLHRWKRVDLAIRALKLIRDPIALLIAGTGEDEPYFKQLADGDPRVKFLGYVSDEELIELYAHAFAILFLPKEEDFGYITVEAMMSHKPVITCTDSGEPSRLVQDGVTGFVVPPDPAELAAAIQLLLKDRRLARDMGEDAFASAPKHSWNEIALRLLEAGRSNSRTRIGPIEQKSEPLPKILVTDNQVLNPPVGGARVRVRKLCEELSHHFQTEYVGAFDWSGPESTEQQLATPLRARVMALASLHHRLVRRLQKLVSGGSVIDVTFPLLARLSTEFTTALHQSLRQANVVIFSHPWVFPLVEKEVANKLVIYDAHNFEGRLRSQLLSETPVGRLLAHYAKWVEKRLVRKSRAIFVCSEEDGDAMATSYNVPGERFHLIPNCADTEAIQPASEDSRLLAKKSLGWQGRPIALFVGSGYGPNTKAAGYLIEELAPKFPEVLFAIVGSVKEDYLRSANPLHLAKLFSPPKLPCCLAHGWYDPETWGPGKLVRWTAPKFSLCMLADSPGKLTLQFISPQKNLLMITQGGRPLVSPISVHEGENSLEIGVPHAGYCEFRLKKAHFVQGHPRPLGCAVLSLAWTGSTISSIQLDLSRGTAEDLLPENVRLLGVVSDDVLERVLQASDVAINPVELGSGTNLKMLQFMAAGLPILSTPAGTRGIKKADSFCIVAERSDFNRRLGELLSDAPLRVRLGKAARNVAVKHYDWRIAGERAASIIQRKLKYVRRMELPFFSVIVPTFQRPSHLHRLLEALARQSFPDFEVVIVDQSETLTPVRDSLKSKLRLRVIHTSIKGAVVARNWGIQEARGAVLAFTDDDCVPSRDWLERAAEHFDRSSIAGLEGRIWTSKQGHPRYRTVTNVGFEGFGFMTANLFLRKVLVEKAGGFDERFDHPHFREDTDLAWRVLEFGEIPYATDVAVYHPPHPVRLKRESPEERAKMFVQDSLLFAEHPERYPRLFFAEAHYRKTEGFWTYFLEGIKRHRVEPPLEILLNELEKRNPGLWGQLNAPVEGNYRGTGDLVLSKSDITALRPLLGQEGTPKCFSAK